MVFIGPPQNILVIDISYWSLSLKEIFIYWAFNHYSKLLWIWGTKCLQVFSITSAKNMYRPQKSRPLSTVIHFWSGLVLLYLKPDPILSGKTVTVFCINRIYEKYFPNIKSQINHFLSYLYNSQKVAPLFILHWYTQDLLIIVKCVVIPESTNLPCFVSKFHPSS